MWLGTMKAGLKISILDIKIINRSIKSWVHHGFILFKLFPDPNNLCIMKRHNKLYVSKTKDKR